MEKLVNNYLSFFIGNTAVQRNYDVIYSNAHEKKMDFNKKIQIIATRQD